MPTRRPGTSTQYFEMFGHRAIDHDGWRAVCPWPGPSFAEAGSRSARRSPRRRSADLDAHHWELYHVAEDFAETRDLAAEHREKLIEMIAQWYVEAGRYGVLPIDGSALTRMMVERPQIARSATSYTFWPGTQPVPFAVAPKVLNRPHSITADVEIPADGAEGVLLCQGASTAGFTFYLQGGRLHYAHNYVGRAIHRRLTASPSRRAAHSLAFRVRAHR